MKKYLLAMYIISLPLLTQAQIPTPTPYMFDNPYPPIVIDVNFGMWGYADDVINVWNYYPDVGPVLQTTIILILVFAFVAYVVKLIRDIMDSNL